MPRNAGGGSSRCSMSSRSSTSAISRRTSFRAAIAAGLRHRGIGVLITDHNVEQTLDIVDRAYIMFEGRVQVAGTVRQLVFDDRVAELYLGPTLTTRLRSRLAPVPV